jgi:hypothetical protein
MALRSAPIIFWMVAIAARSSAQEPVAAYLAALTAQLPAPAAAVLPLIDGDGRRLLAVRSYLGAGKDLAARWSWTDEQIAAYEGSEAQRATLAEVEKVKARFAELNPGFGLFVQTQVRSLDAQVEKWNENPSVDAAAEAMLEAAQRELATYSLRPQDAALKRFTQWTRGWSPPARPNLAAPGLSAHGRGNAFDFQVMQGDTIIAGTDTRAIALDWDAAGWSTKLADAVKSASPRFHGPLASPYEPWHYEYVP